MLPFLFSLWVPSVSSGAPIALCLCLQLLDTDFQHHMSLPGEGGGNQQRNDEPNRHYLDEIYVSQETGKYREVQQLKFSKIALADLAVQLLL